MKFKGLSFSTVVLILVFGLSAQLFAAPPANDNFVSAKTMTGASGAKTGTNIDATKEVGEPKHAGEKGGASVWWKWTPTHSGTVTIDTNGSAIDTLLAAYTGTSVSALTEIASNNDVTPADEWSLITFDVVAGTTYYIAVDGFGLDEGDIDLNWMLYYNDFFDYAIEITSLSTSISDSNIECTKETGEPFHAGNAGGASIWWKWSTDQSGTVVIDTKGSAIDTLLAVYQGDAVDVLTTVASNDDIGTTDTDSLVTINILPGRVYYIVVDGKDAAKGNIKLNLNFLTNDNFADAYSVSALTGSYTRNNIGASKEIGEPDHAGVSGGASIWWAWTPTVSGEVTFDTDGSAFDTLLAVYTGTAVDLLTEVVSSDDDPAISPQSSVTFDAVAGTTYYIAVDGKDGDTGTYTLSWLQLFNDYFEDAFEISGFGGTQTATNIGASKEAGEPRHAGAVGGASVWWKWQAPVNGEVIFDTLGSNFDTVMGVYTGAAVDALTEVASNDDDPYGTGTQSVVTFIATAGTTYYIAVDGYGAETGDITLNWLLALNDDFTDAEVITGTSGTLDILYTNTYASKETGEPAHAGNAGGASLWWSFTPTVDGPVTFDTDGSGINTLLAVYTGSAVDALTEVTSNDDDQNLSPRSLAAFMAVAGTTYYITVDGYNGATGNINLSWDTVLNDDFADKITLAGFSASYSGSNRGATSEEGEPDHAGQVAISSIWWTWTAPVNGQVTINTDGSGYDTLLGIYTGSTVSGLYEVASNDDDDIISPQSSVTFVVSSGVTYHIAVAGKGRESGDTVINLSMLFNDDFDDAIEIAGDSGSLLASNIGATKETGEDDHAGNRGGVSVWWMWTSTKNGTVTFDTDGSAIDTLLAAYIGNSVDNLIERASDDNGTALAPQSSITFWAYMGETYYIVIDGAGYETGDVALNWSFVYNDNFADALPLSIDDEGYATANNADATFESGEPAHAGVSGGASIWWAWTPVQNCNVTFDTRGSSFDTLLAVYTGTYVAGLTEVVSNDDDTAISPLSKVNFDAVAGTTYYIAVDGNAGDTGLVRLNWSLTFNDDFADADVITGYSGTTSPGYNNYNATEEPGEPDHSGVYGRNSIWFEWTAPSDGKVTFDTIGSQESTGAALTTLLGVYTGSYVESLTEVASGNGLSGTDTTVTLDVVQGTTLHIAVDSEADTYGDIVLSWSLIFNDDFYDAYELFPGGTTGVETGLNFHATTETGEPDHAGALPNASVWWKFEATQDTSVTLSTNGSDFDTVLAVYTGNSVSSLTDVASDDNYDPDGDGVTDLTYSQVTFPVTTGQTYRIAIDGYGGATGNIVINWFVVNNDDYDDAIDKTNIAYSGGAYEWTDIQYNNGAGKEYDEPAHAGSEAKASLWWKWTAPDIGKVIIDTFDSSFDTRLAVYHGSSVSSLTGVISNDDYQVDGDGTSRVEFEITKADLASDPDYYIAVDGNNGEEGECVVNFKYWFNDDIEDAYLFDPTLIPNGTSSYSTIASNVYATNQAVDGEPAHALYGPSRSLWWIWTTEVASSVTFHTIGSGVDTLIAAYTAPDPNYPYTDIIEIASNDDIEDPNYFDPNNPSGAITTESLMTFSALPGTEYYIAVDQRGGNTQNIVLNWFLTTANDNFEDAFTLSSPKGTTTGTNIGATAETDEPDHNGVAAASSVWWTWTTSLDVVATFTVDLPGANIAIYSGEAVESLSEVASGTGEVSFDTTADTVYYIAVDGAVGFFNLSWYTTYNNDLEDAFEIVIGDSTSGTEEGANIEADAEDGEFELGLKAFASLWWTWKAPSNCSVTFDTTSSSVSANVAALISPNGDPPADMSDLRFVVKAGTSITFEATGGVTYYLVVDSAGYETGDVKLDWEFVVFTLENPEYADYFEYTLNNSILSTTYYGAISDFNNNPDEWGGTHPIAVLWVPPTSGKATLTVTSTSTPAFMTRFSVYHLYAKVPDEDGLYWVDIEEELNDQDNNRLAVTVTDLNPTATFNVLGDSNWYLIIIDSSSTGAIKVDFDIETNDDISHAFDLSTEENIADRNKYILRSSSGDTPGGYTVGFTNYTMGDLDADSFVDSYPGSWMATSEPNEPNHLTGTNPNATLWFKWTPDVNSSVLFTATNINRSWGIENPGVIAAYSVDPLHAADPNFTYLTPVTSNIAATSVDAVSFDAYFGTQYYIAIDGQSGNNGLMKVVWNYTNNDFFEDAYLVLGSGYIWRKQAISGNVYHTDYSYNAYASSEVDEPGTPTASLWWHWYADVDGIVVFNTLGSDFDTYLAAYEDEEAYLYSSYDYITGRTEILYDGLLDDLELVAESYDISDSNLLSEIHFNVNADDLYSIVVDTETGIVGDAILNWYTITNDFFFDAITLTGISGSTEGYNSYTALESLEPVHAGVNNDHSVWWVWTPTISGNAVIDTMGSEFDTVLGIYTGTHVRNCVEKVSNDDISPTDANSLVSFYANAGTPYYIAVAGKNNGIGAESGKIILNYAISQYHSLTVTGSVDGSVVIDGTTYQLPVADMVIPAGSTVDLTAVAAKGWGFVDWTVNTPSFYWFLDPTDPNQSIVMNYDFDLTINFSNWIDLEEFADIARVWDANGIKEVSVPQETAYWKLDDPNITGSNVIPAEPSDYDGILRSDDPDAYSDDAAFGQSILLAAEPNDYIETPFVIDPNSGSFSAFAWVKGSGTAQPDQTILAQGNGDSTLGNGRRWLYNYGDTDFGLATSLKTKNGSILVSDFDISDGDWHHVGVVVTQDKVAKTYRRVLYADGKAVTWDNAEGLPGSIEFSNGIMFIGSDKTEAPSRLWDGYIDDVRIYDQALTSQQVMAVMGGFDGPQTGITCTEQFDADFNDDCVVGIDDIAIFADEWLTLQQ